MEHEHFHALNLSDMEVQYSSQASLDTLDAVVLGSSSGVVEASWRSELVSRTSTDVAQATGVVTRLSSADVVLGITSGMVEPEYSAMDVMSSVRSSADVRSLACTNVLTWPELRSMQSANTTSNSTAPAVADGRHTESELPPTVVE